MAISCEPKDLVAAAACYQCIPPGMIEPVKTYLLAVLAGLDGLTPSELVDRAKCYNCIPPGMQKPIQTALLCMAIGGTT